jgi:hypothetical protein
VELVETSWCIKQFLTIENWTSEAETQGFDVLEIENVTDAVLPNVLYLHKMAHLIITHVPAPLLKCGVHPSTMNNMISVLMLPFAYENGTLESAKIVFQRRDQ